MLHILILISNILFYCLFLIIPISFDCCKKKKRKVDGKTVADDPPSKKCNLKDGLLADDPDLKSFQLRKIEEEKKKKAAEEQKQLPPQPNQPKSSQAGTDLRSFDDDGGPKKKKDQPKTAVPTPADVPPTGPAELGAMSTYAGAGKTIAEGVSVLAMQKVDKEKLPVKLLPKEPEVIAQDPTQNDDTKSKSKKVEVSNVGSKKGGGSVHGGTEDKKKIKNLENMLDAMMDKTQEDNDDGGKKPVDEGKTQVPTKYGELKTSVLKLKEEESPHDKMEKPKGASKKTQKTRTRTRER